MWFQRASEKGHKSALDSLLEAAGQGNVDALISVGDIVGSWLRKGAERDPAEAVMCYREAAEQGDARGQRKLGSMLERGDGVAQDLSEAMKWYRFAAEQGDAEANACLGEIFLGGKGVTRDPVQALQWYRAAAELGLAPAQYVLGTILDPDPGGPLAQFAHDPQYIPRTIQDLAEAIQWYRASAEQGHKAAQHKLGSLLANGKGVGRDLVEAAEWSGIPWRLCVGTEPLRSRGMPMRSAISG